MKNLNFKRIALIYTLALLFFGSIVALGQATVAVVYDETATQVLPDGSTTELPAETPAISLFEEDGYDVELVNIVDLSAGGSETTIAALEAADLVYIGRRVGSTNFESPKKEVWNSLQVPIMTENMWALRSNRMNWFNTDEIHIETELEDTEEVYATIVEAGDEVFNDMEVDDSVAWWYGPHNIIDPADGDVGNGTVLATARNGKPVFVRFEVGNEFYSGSVDQPANERVYFGLGCEVNNSNQYYCRFTELSKEVFLREAARLSGHSRGEPGDIEEVYKESLASKVFLNPSIQQLVVEMDQLMKVQIIDMTGKQVYSSLVNKNEITIDMDFTKVGVYLVILTDNNNNFVTHKIIKQ